MRVALVLAAWLLLLPAPAAAGLVKAIELQYLNSDLTFGHAGADQSGWDGELTSPYFVPFDGTYQTLSGPLVKQTLLYNAGTVIGSEYLYQGGTFFADFAFWNDGQLITGAFTAPIVTLTIQAGDDVEGGVLAAYVLGPGEFDNASLAHALGLKRPHTNGGSIWSELLLTDSGNRPGIGGDHTTPERQAWDGVAWVTLTVPEPSMLMLGLVGLGTVWRHRRRAVSAPPS
jgi:MYXO-CTERM domain-containing protein